MNCFVAFGDQFNLCTDVNLMTQAQKKLVEDMIVEEDTIDGLELVEAKIFK